MYTFSNFDEFTDRLQNDSEENIQTIPTIGFNVEVLQYKNIKFQVNEERLIGAFLCVAFIFQKTTCLKLSKKDKTLNSIKLTAAHLTDVQVWDLGGQTSIRPYWRCYYPNTDAIIFVVDSCDNERLGIAKQELMAMLEVRTKYSQSKPLLDFHTCLLWVLACM